MSANLAEFLGRLSELERGYALAQRKQVAACALAVTKLARTNIRSASGGDSRLSGVGKKGAKVGVRYDVTGTAQAVAIVRATGPLHLIERDTKPGVRPHKRRRGRGKNRFVGPIRGYGHPGTKGKHPFEKAVVAAEAVVGPIAHDLTYATIAKIYRS